MGKSILLLLVEDETLILQHVEDVLTDGGYEVLTAYDAEEALARLAGETANLAALITDIRLGKGIDGWELARQAREMNAGMAVVYITGGGAADWAAQGVPKSLVVQKPFADAQLVTAVSMLLNDADSTL